MDVALNKDEIRQDIKFFEDIIEIRSVT